MAHNTKLKPGQWVVARADGRKYRIDDTRNQSGAHGDEALYVVIDPAATTFLHCRKTFFASELVSLSTSLELGTDVIIDATGRIGAIEARLPKSRVRVRLGDGECVLT